MEIIHPTSLHHITVVQATANRRHPSLVACPRRGETVGVDVCATCEVGRGLAGDVVLCAAPPRPASSRTVADVMSRDVVCVREDVDLTTVSWLLTRHRVSGVPVVDVERRVQGMVTRGDFVRALGERLLGEGEAWIDSFDPVRSSAPLQTAGALMSPAASVGEHDDIDVIARRFREHRVRAAPVVDDEGRLVGIVSALDLLRALQVRLSSS